MISEGFHPIPPKLLYFVFPIWGIWDGISFHSNNEVEQLLRFTPFHSTILSFISFYSITYHQSKHSLNFRVPSLKHILSLFLLSWLFIYNPNSPPTMITRMSPRDVAFQKAQKSYKLSRIQYTMKHLISIHHTYCIFLM